MEVKQKSVEIHSQGDYNIQANWHPNGIESCSSKLKQKSHQ